MPTPAQLDGVRRTLNRLSAAARADLTAVWNALPAQDGEAVRKLLGPEWLAIIGSYGEASAVLAADVFEEWAHDLRIKPRVKLVASVDEARAGARLGWAASTPAILSNLTILTDELVKQPYRSTMQGSAWKSGAGWARVPSGPKTCEWCLMLASRGGVYGSKELADMGTDGKKYHGDCDCTPALVR